jgi:hypothetical protein
MKLVCELSRAMKESVYVNLWHPQVLTPSVFMAVHVAVGCFTMYHGACCDGLWSNAGDPCLGWSNRVSTYVKKVLRLCTKLLYILGVQ